MDGDDSGPFSLTQPSTDSSGYPVSSSSLVGQYHVWAAASTSSTVSNSNNSGSLPTHFSPVSPTGHGMYNDHLSLHPSQAAVDMLSVRLGQGDYHSSTADRLSQGDGYHGAAGSDASSRHQTNQSDYHDHLLSQERHLALDSYHHISASASSSSTQQQDRLAQTDYHSSQQADRLGQGDYHSGQQASRLGQSDYHGGQQAERLGQSDYHSAQQQDRLGQNDYHSGQQSDRLGQSDYHVSPQPDRLGQLDYHGGQNERLNSLGKQDYHGLGSDRLGQQAATYHPGQASDRGLGAQADYHPAQVDLEAVQSMHADFERRHLDVGMLSKDLVDSGQRGSAMDYLTSQANRDPLASLNQNIVGLQREIDLSVGQTVSPSQRSAPTDLASTSYGLDPATLPRDLSPYSQRDLGVAMMSASESVVGQVTDGSGRSGAAAAGVNLHPQDLAGINLSAAPRELVDMTSLTRPSTSRDDMGRGRDVIHRPRDIQRALEVLGSLENSTSSVDLTLNGGSSSKSSSRSYPSTSRLASSTKRPPTSTSQASEIRTQNPLPTVSAGSSSLAGVNFFPLPSSRDPLNIIVASDPSVAGPSSRHGTCADFSRQPGGEMSRLRRELTAPYPDLSVHHSMLASTATVPVPTFKSTVEPLFNAHGDQLLCTEALTSSRERLYEMMKQQQFCDAVLGTTLHSIKVHKAILCSASAYLCGVLSQTCMGKSGGRILTVQFKADIPASSLSAFIDYIYQGRIKLSIKSARDLNVMARCLHMESLKKTSEEMLLAMGMNNDIDLSIPELLLLETLVDKFDKACTASFPVPAPAPPSCDVGVATDSPIVPAVVEESCQTDEAPASSCSCSCGAIDLRSGGSCVRLGGLGTLSLAQNSGMSVVGGTLGGDSIEPVLPVSSSTPTMSSPLTVAKSHHKKHLASQANRAKAEASSTPTPPLSASSSASESSAATSVSHQMQNRSVDSETHSSNTAHSSSTSISKTVTSKPRKRTSTPTSSLSPTVPSPSINPVLPGQTARTIHHSYGTRAASRTPTKLLDSASSLQLTSVGRYGHYAASKVSSGDVDTEAVKQTTSDTTSDTQSQMAKHRGRTKKGRIAAALFEAFSKSSQSADSDQRQESSERSKDSPGELLAKLPHVPASQGAVAIPTSSVTATSSSTTTALTEAKRSAPRAYRKRLIQSVVSSQSLLAEKQASEERAEDKDSAVRTADNSSGEDRRGQARADGQHITEEEQTETLSSEQLRENLHSPVTARRKKKGKARRMLLSSPSGSGGVRVRAPPKKRAKMELELEKLMREEMEEEEEEEEAAAAGSSATRAVDQGESLVDGQAEWASEQQASVSRRRIKMPSTRPGKRARWIKNDQLSALLIELNRKAGSITEGECIYTCGLCNNQFLLPKRCLSHVMTTHKVPEAEVIDNILVRQREEGEKCAEEVTISVNLICDICGYRSRDNTTYYLHYHKYFKHGVALPKGWTVYTCDLCGKELYTKFQLKDHKRTHAEKTPFVCEICGSGFQSRSNLHSHVLHRHKEEKKHSCGMCVRTFKTRTQLAVHERTHTGVRPFSCPQCSYRSTTRGNMRLHLVNRHKISSNSARDIMRDMKPDIDLSLKPVWQQASSDSGGEKKLSSPSKRKSNSGGSGSLKKEKEAEEMEVQPISPPVSVSSNSKQGLVMDSSAMELFLKHATGEGGSSDNSQENKEADSGDLGGSSVMLNEGDTSVVTLQAAEAFPAPTGVGMCGETAAVTFLPPGLETVFHQPQSDIGVTSTVPSTAATTIIVPENFLLQHHTQAFQHHHKQHLYHHQPPHFASFVVGAAPALQTLTSSDLVSATALNPDSLKSEEVNAGVVDLGDMGVGVMDRSLDGTLRQGGLGSTDLNFQASGTSLSQQTVSPNTSQQSSDQLYLQHSPISPAPPMSPTPVYVAVTPTPQPLTPGKQDTEMQDAAAAGTSVVLDQVPQQVPPMHPYDASLLQAYYPSQFYSQSY